MYQALYRKWRPKTFDEVVGQNHITQSLKNQVKTGRLSHAYIFIGTRGTGKTTCARILAKAVNCEHPVDGNPCGVCPACRGISEGTVLDVVELDAASNNSVDNVRNLREEAVFSPAAVKKRVYIIDEVHMLSTAAFNALLKILEEPPEHLMFILATTELQKVPATILSRCQRHSFKRIDTAVLSDYLEDIAGRERFTLQHEAAQLIARLADGGVRDALSLLDQCSASENIDLDAVYNAMGLAGNRRTAELMDCILNHETEKAVRIFDSLWMDGKDPGVMLTELSGLLRDILMMKVAPKGGASLISGAYDNTTLVSLGERMNLDEILSAMETIQTAQTQARSGGNPKVTVELCLVNLCESMLSDSVSALRARVSRLEEQVRQGIPVRAAAVPEAESLPYAGENRDALPVEYPDPEPEPAFFAEQPEDRAPVPETGGHERIPAELPERRSPYPERTPPPAAAAAAGTETVRPPEQSADEQRPSVQPASPASASLSWEQIREAAKPVLPRDIAAMLGDENSIRGCFDGSTVHIEAVPGFIYTRVNRQEILTKFAQTAQTLCGHPVRAAVEELSNKPSENKEKRSLEDLKQFKEVRFV